MFGALLGALIGILFGIAGLFVGPVIGAVAGEFIAGKRMIDAGRAGWGSLLGNLGAMMGKLIYRAGNDHDFLYDGAGPGLSLRRFSQGTRVVGGAPCRFSAFSSSPVVINYSPMADDRWRVLRWRDLLEEVRTPYGGMPRKTRGHRG